MEKIDRDIILKITRTFREKNKSTIKYSICPCTVECRKDGNIINIHKKLCEENAFPLPNNLPPASICKIHSRVICHVASVEAEHCAQLYIKHFNPQQDINCNCQTADCFESIPIMLMRKNLWFPRWLLIFFCVRHNFVHSCGKECYTKSNLHRNANESWIATGNTRLNSLDVVQRMEEGFCGTDLCPSCQQGDFCQFHCQRFLAGHNSVCLFSDRELPSGSYNEMQYFHVNADFTPKGTTGRTHGEMLATRFQVYLSLWAKRTIRLVEQIPEKDFEEEMKQYLNKRFGIHAFKRVENGVCYLSPIPLLDWYFDLMSLYFKAPGDDFYQVLSKFFFYFIRNFNDQIDSDIFSEQIESDIYSFIQIIQKENFSIYSSNYRLSPTQLTISICAHLVAKKDEKVVVVKNVDEILKFVLRQVRYDYQLKEFEKDKTYFSLERM